VSGHRLRLVLRQLTAGCGLALGILLGAVLVGCGNVAPRSSPAPEPVAAPVTPVAVVVNNPVLSAFEAQQQAAAEQAARQGRWADVIWALDVLQALRPADNTLAPRRAQAEQAAAAAATDSLRQAKFALQRGDADAAVGLYMDVLSLQPGQPEAAEALRAIERERVARQQLGLSARNSFARTAAGERPERPERQKAEAGNTSSRNELEHASMLAEQGETNAAIALLKPIAATSTGPAAARRLLADLYLRQADALWPHQGAAAIAAAERGLQANPMHKILRARLALWRGNGDSAPR
jgi:hypothetical protein